jgi:hypothetical protein
MSSIWGPWRCPKCRKPFGCHIDADQHKRHCAVPQNPDRTTPARFTEEGEVINIRVIRGIIKDGGRITFFSPDGTKKSGVVTERYSSIIVKVGKGQA